MAAMSDYLENKLVDFIFRAQSFTAPTTIYVALCTAATSDSQTGSSITEVSTSGPGYNRQLLEPDATVWAATQGGTSTPSTGTGGTTSNLMAVTFGPALSSWGTITHVALLDAETSGNLLFHGALTTSRAIDTDDTLVFQIGDLAVQVDN